MTLATTAIAQDATTASPEIGTVVAVTRNPTAELDGTKRPLRVGTRLRKSELVSTDANAQVELELDDRTKIALGTNAGLRIADYTTAQSGATPSVAVDLLKGTFRFLTGSQEKAAYKISTPSATVGVRGTIFDVYVDGKGDTLVLLHEGEVDVCNRSRNCERHNAIGRIIHATIAGVLSAPIKFTDRMIPGLSVGRAFPFIGRTLKIDPIRRLRATDLVDPVTRPLGNAGREIENGAGAIGRTIRRGLPF